MIIADSCIIWFHFDCIIQLKKSYHIATNVCSRKRATTFGDLPDWLLSSQIWVTSPMGAIASLLAPGKLLVNTIPIKTWWIHMYYCKSALLLLPPQPPPPPSPRIPPPPLQADAQYSSETVITSMLNNSVYTPADEISWNSLPLRMSTLYVLSIGK